MDIQEVKATIRKEIERTRRRKQKNKNDLGIWNFSDGRIDGLDTALEIIDNAIIAAKSKGGD